MTRIFIHLFILKEKYPNNERTNEKNHCFFNDFFSFSSSSKFEVIRLINLIKKYEIK